MLTKENAGSTLLKHRHEHKLTQQQVAEKSGVSVQTLSGIEGGSITPQSMTVFKLSEYLKQFTGG